MNIPFVDLYSQYLTIKPEIDLAIQDVIINSEFIKGKHVELFEKQFAALHNVKHCIGVANGTDALFIALKMLGIGKGDEVITTALSWISTSETISLTGAKPVFVDVEEDYFTINPTKIEEKITEQTKAIIPVHFYGQCAEMDIINYLARKYNLKIIEDNAQAHFALYKGKLAGTLGDISTFSFYPGKNLGAYGDAGAIITNNDELAEKMRMFANHGALKKHYHYIEGINSRLDGIQAAILNVKLKYIELWSQKRRENAYYYNELLSNINHIITTPKERENSKHVYHVYCIKTNERDKLKMFLESKGINTAIHYPKALPNLKAYTYLGHIENDFPIASKLQNNILSLPMYPELIKNQIEYISNSIIEYFGNE